MKRILCSLLVLLLMPVAFAEETYVEEPYFEEIELFLGEEEAVSQPAADAVVPMDLPGDPVAEPVFPILTFTKNQTVKMNLGEALQLDLNGQTAKSYKSSAAKVAAVSASGVVTAIKAGKAKITVALAKKKLTLTVQVVDPTVPTGISLNKKETVYIGMPMTLVPVLTPDTAVSTISWKSSNKKVATVDANGVVTGLKKGTAKITATTANKKKATVTVTVVPVPMVVKIVAYGDCGDYNHVGYNWDEEYTFGKVRLDWEPLTTTLCAGDTVALKAKLTEIDKYPDVGSKTVKHTFTQRELEEGALIRIPVSVKENKGRYRGCVANWTVTFEVTPVVNPWEGE